MAFTENAAGFGAGSKSRIKTLDKTLGVVKKPSLESMMLTEDDAIAAFSMKNLTPADLAKQDQEETKKVVKKQAIKPKKKIVKKVKAFVPKSDPSLPESNIDLTSITSIEPKKEEDETGLTQVEEALGMPSESLTGE